MRRSRQLACWSAAAVGVWLVLASAIGIVMAEAALHPLRRAITPDDETRAQDVSAREGAVLSDVAVAAGDGAMLRAWSLVPRKGPDHAPLAAGMLAGVGLLGLGFRRKIGRRLAVIAALACLASLSGLCGCLGPSGLAMTPGKYLYTLNASSDSASASATFYVTVQCNSCP